MALLRRVRDIDIVLGGHDHELRVWYDGRQAILKSRSQGRYVGILNLALDRELGQAIGRTAVELELRVWYDGRFPQVAGLSFVFDVRRPPGSRITSVEVAGAAGTVAPVMEGRIVRED